MLLKEEAEVAHIKSGSQGEIGNVLRISHDAHATKIVIYMILRTDRTVLFHHPSSRESRALEIHRRGRHGEREGKDTFVAKRKVAEHCKTLSH